MGDLNNTAAMRPPVHFDADPAYAATSLAITAANDDPEIRAKYRPFLLPDEIASSDWVAKLELSTALKMVEREVVKPGKERIRVLVLFGSLRRR